MDHINQNEIIILLYQMNYDHVRTSQEDDQYLCIAKIAGILKSNGFTLEDFLIPSRQSKTYIQEQLIPLWNAAKDHPKGDLNELYDIISTPFNAKRDNGIIYLDEIEEKEVEWLIPNFIPKIQSH